MIRQAQMKLLVIEDDLIEVARIRQELASWAIFHFSDLNSFTKFQENSENVPDVVLIDVYLGGSSPDGIVVAKQSRVSWPSAAIIVHSYDLGSVKDAMLVGADDFLDKGSPPGEIQLRIENIFRRRLHNQHACTSQSIDVVGATMRAIRQRAPHIIQSAVRSIHIQGESGTGKEVVTEVLEKSGANPFVRVNCAAISESLFDHELFGSAKGSFTGSIKDKAGLIEIADGGFLFLDEVATLPLTVQAKLLRFLDNGEFRRVGENLNRRLDVRLVTATNENLEEMVQIGKFRNDLLQRLTECVIELPPLRERSEEVPELAEHLCSNFNGGPYRLSPSTLSLLCQYDWRRGNVRELRNVLRAMTEHNVNGVLTPLSLPKDFWNKLDSEREDPRTENETLVDPKDILRGKARSTSNSVDSIKEQITIEWNGNGYDDVAILENLLLLEIVKRALPRVKRRSIREIANFLQISRITLADRLRTLVLSKHITAEELKLVTGLEIK